jgi:phage-related protein
MVAETAEVRQFTRTFQTNYKAFYWQSPEGLNNWPYVYANKWMYEDKLDQNPPRAARVYALLGAAMHDAFIASQDSKSIYWYIPPQLDTIKPLHVLSYQIGNIGVPVSASCWFYSRRGERRGDSRIWAGIHFQIDNEAGAQLGRSVSQKFIPWANADGSQ